MARTRRQRLPAPTISFVYALCHPITMQVKYIGYTHHPNKRLKLHISEAKIMNKSLKHKWINELCDNGLMPKMVILERIEIQLVPERETYWVNRAIILGCDLFNHLGQIASNASRETPRHYYSTIQYGSKTD